MTPNVVPKGWTKGQELQQVGGPRIARDQRYQGYLGISLIALMQYWEKWPSLSKDAPATDTVLAIAFKDIDDVNQWLDWWYAD